MKIIKQKGTNLHALIVDWIGWNQVHDQIIFADFLADIILKLPLTMLYRVPSFDNCNMYDICEWLIYLSFGVWLQIKATSSFSRNVFLECRSYLSLSEYHRAQSYTGLTTCDRLLKPSWYRITGLAGNRMPDSCVPKQRCGTHAPGWLVGGHPTVAQGSVARRVCFHWLNSCCRWSAGVLVRNCGLFYTYYLTPPPTCNLRYCGNRGGAGKVKHFNCALQPNFQFSRSVALFVALHKAYPAKSIFCDYYRNSQWKLV